MHDAVGGGYPGRERSATELARQDEGVAPRDPLLIGMEGGLQNDLPPKGTIVHPEHDDPRPPDVDGGEQGIAGEEAEGGDPLELAGAAARTAEDADECSGRIEVQDRGAGFEEQVTLASEGVGAEGEEGLQGIGLGEHQRIGDGDDGAGIRRSLIGAASGEDHEPGRTELHGRVRRPTVAETGSSALVGQPVTRSSAESGSCEEPGAGGCR